MVASGAQRQRELLLVRRVLVSPASSLRACVFVLARARGIVGRNLAKGAQPNGAQVSPRITSSYLGPR